MRIGLTYDLKTEYSLAGYDDVDTAEMDTPETIDALASAIENLGHTPVRIGNVKALTRALVHGQRWDLVLNICEGLEGFSREAQVPAVLEAFGVPYTFSDPLVCAIALHKGITKHVMRSHGIRTPDFAVVSDAQEARRLELPLPLVVKPVAEGTSKGITPASLVELRPRLVETCENLIQRHRQPVIVERFLPGREFTVGILGTGSAARVLATMEIILRPEADRELYSFANKAQYRELVEYRLLRNAALRTRVDSLALAAWRCLGCRDAGRVDVRLDELGVPQFLELNPLAGLNPWDSDLPIMARLTGLGYAALIGEIIASAMKRRAVRQRTAASAA